MATAIIHGRLTAMGTTVIHILRSVAGKSLFSWSVSCGKAIAMISSGAKMVQLVVLVVLVSF